METEKELFEQLEILSNLHLQARKAIIRQSDISLGWCIAGDFSNVNPQDLKSDTITNGTDLKTSYVVYKKLDLTFDVDGVQSLFEIIRLAEIEQSKVVDKIISLNAEL